MNLPPFSTSDFTLISPLTESYGHHQDPPGIAE